MAHRHILRPLLRSILLPVLLAGSAAAVLAQTPSAAAAATPGIDARQQRQEARIDQGVAAGQITHHEARKLHRQQRKIALAEARAKADGKVTRAERRHLQHMQDHASRQIHRQRHDRRQRPDAAGSAHG